MKHSKQLKQFVVSTRKEYPFKQWAEVAEIVNKAFNQKLSARAVGHIYERYVEGEDEIGYPARYSAMRELPKNHGNLAVIGDLHAPFIKKGYLEFVQHTAKNYDCQTFVFVGDILDQHANSRHLTHAGGLSSGHEFSEAKKQLKQWFKAIPEAFICVGNHDKIYFKRSEELGISPVYLKTYEQLLDCPVGWQWGLSWRTGNVLIEHGTKAGGKNGVLNRAINFGCCVVAGHQHSIAQVYYHKTLNDLIWGMSVGSGVDEYRYAFNYAAENKARYINSMGVITFTKGQAFPIVVPM